MNNNDVLRRLRYILDYRDEQMIAAFKSVDIDVSRSQVSDWLKKPDDENRRPMNDYHLAAFLNGIINMLRGKRPGPQPPIEKELNNNIVFRKLRIAFNLKDTEILQMIDKAGMRFSKHELSAFFRKPTQTQYRSCQDQILRKFLKGLQMTKRPSEKKNEKGNQSTT